MGLDVEYILVGTCDSALPRVPLEGGDPIPGYCPELEKLARSGSKWVRFLVLWRWNEPNPPTGDPGGYGHLAGDHTYSWDHEDYMVNYAQNLGLNVYLTVLWAPQWANGADCVDTANCGPLGGKGDDTTVGYAVKKPEYISDLFYNLVTHFSQDRQSAGLQPVKYYGVWNEPNFRTNFNPCNVTSGNCAPGHEDDTGYLQAFVNYYLQPAHDALKVADPTAQLVAPDLADRCGVPSWSGNRDCWFDYWAKPLLESYGFLFDILSIHRYDGDHGGVKAAVGKVGKLLVANTERPNSAKLPLFKPLWLTEVGGWKTTSGNTQNVQQNMFWLEVDRINRQNYWQMSFYNSFQDGPESSGGRSCNGSGIICSDDTEKPTYGTFQWLHGVQSASPAGTPAAGGSGGDPTPFQKIAEFFKVL
jgi:hypothetical protein